MAADTDPGPALVLIRKNGEIQINTERITLRQFLKASMMLAVVLSKRLDLIDHDARVLLRSLATSHGIILDALDRRE